jgi:hypothetical protein
MLTILVKETTLISFHRMLILTSARPNAETPQLGSQVRGLGVVLN